MSVQNKEQGRETKHDDCQYHHDDDGDRLLSPRAAMKVHEVILPDLQVIGEQRTADRAPWTSA
jgi:hypothetical protein